MSMYANPCPQCGSPMYDQLDPNNKFPWKPGRPIAVCTKKKETGCEGVFWAPKGQPMEIPGQSQHPAPATKAAPVQTRAEFVPAVVVKYEELLLKASQQHMELFSIVADSYAALLDKATGTKKEILAMGSADTIAAITATIAIGMQRR